MRAPVVRFAFGFQMEDVLTKIRNSHSTHKSHCLPFMVNKWTGLVPSYIDGFYQPRLIIITEPLILVNGDAWDHPSVTSPSSRTQPASQNVHQKTSRWWLRKYFQWNTEQSRALLKENKPSLFISSLSNWPFLNVVLFPHVHPIGHDRIKVITHRVHQEMTWK